jgi:hypothetical protein
LGEGGIETADPFDIVAARDHPQTFHEVEERIGITLGPEEDTLCGLLIERRNRTIDDLDVAVARRAQNAFLIDELHPKREGLMHVSAV